MAQAMSMFNGKGIEVNPRTIARALIKFSTSPLLVNSADEG